MAALALLVGCATLSGRKQRVAVDSEPRGATIRDAAGEVLGTTPDVVRVPRDRTLHFTIEAGEVSRPLTMRCDVRWWIAMLGNAPFGMVTAAQLGWGMAAAVGVDFWTGAAYECGPTASVKLPGAAGVEACRTLLVLPPDHDDYAEQDAMAAGWAASVQPTLKACERVLLPRAHRVTFARLGMEEAETAGRMEQVTLTRLADATAATHVVRLKYAPAPGEARQTALSGQVEDLFTGEVTPAPAVTLARPAPVSDEFTLRTLFRYIHFLPNSVAYAPSALLLDVEPGAGYSSGTVDQHVSLPALLTGWTLTSAEHPEGFRAWHARWRVEPGFGLGVLDATWRAEGEGMEAFEARSSTWFLRGWYEAGGVVHTPLGAIGAHLIGGGAFIHQEQLGKDPARSFGRGEVGVGLAYTAFMSERTFFRVASSAFGSEKAFVEHATFRVPRFVQNTVVIGYYLPETRAWVRGLFE